MGKSSKVNSPKKISKQAIIGQRGIALIEKIVLEMGHVWQAGSGTLDAGIDGFIELRERDSGIMTGEVIRVQTKASELRFPNENVEGFSFPTHISPLTVSGQNMALEKRALRIVSRRLEEIGFARLNDAAYCVREE